MRMGRSLVIIGAAVASLAFGAAANASTTVSWNGFSDFNSASISFAPISANQLTSISGPGTYEGVGYTTTSFSLYLDLNGSWTDVLNWSVPAVPKGANPPEHLLSSISTPINFSSALVSGIKLTSSPSGQWFDPNYETFSQWWCDSNSETFTFTNTSIGGGGQGTTPLPAAAWMFGSVLAGAGGLQRWRGRNKRRSVTVAA